MMLRIVPLDVNHRVISSDKSAAAYGVAQDGIILRSFMIGENGDATETFANAAGHLSKINKRYETLEREDAHTLETGPFLQHLIDRATIIIDICGEDPREAVLRKKHEKELEHWTVLMAFWEQRHGSSAMDERPHWSSRLDEDQQVAFEEALTDFGDTSDLSQLYLDLRLAGLEPDEAELYVDQMTGDEPVE